MKIYQGKTVPELSQLLGEDVCTFSMLYRILGGKCTKTVTDHKRVIMCLSVSPFPVWVWVAPDADAAELSRVCDTLLAEFPPEAHSYNVGLPLSRALLEKDPSLRVKVRLLGYHCRKAIAPGKRASGLCSPVREEETELAAAWYQAMHAECALNEKISMEKARENVSRYIETKSMFFWRDENGVPKAMCGVSADELGGYISHVYTEPAARRQGYAGNLVHAMAASLLELGKTPMLYTDADYAASNACYTQIGFELQGELCTLAR